MAVRRSGTWDGAVGLLKAKVRSATKNDGVVAPGTGSSCGLRISRGIAPLQAAEMPPHPELPASGRPEHAAPLPSREG